MRKLTPLSLYNRKASLSHVPPDQLGKSLLAFLAAGEAPLLVMFRNLSGVKDPWDTDTSASVTGVRPLEASNA